VGIRSGIANEQGTKDIAMGLTTWSSNGEKFIAFNNVPVGGEVTPYVSRDRDSEESFQGYVSSRIEDFQINATGMNRSKLNPTGSYETAINNDLYTTRDRSLNFDVNYVPEKKEDSRITPTAKIFYDQYQYQSRSPYEDERSNVILSRESDQHVRFGAETSITASIGSDSSLTLGTEAQRISKAELYLYDQTDPQNITLDIDRPFTLFSAYTEANLAVAKNLSILPGVRYDRYSFDVNQTSPRLAAVYNIGEKSTVKMVYGQAFRAANNYERNYTSQTQGANASLSPEKLRSSELIFEHSFSAHWNTSISAFRYSLSDIIEQRATSDGALQFINNDKITSTGVESQVIGKLEDGMLLRFALSYQNATSSFTQRQSSNSPYVLSSLAVAFPTFGDLLYVAPKIRYVGGQKTERGGSVDEFLATDLVVTTSTILPSTDLSFGVYNIFNTAINYPASLEQRVDQIPAEGRIFRAEATVKF
jgi:iron complex outermembrane receptor protein